MMQRDSYAMRETAAVTSVAVREAIYRVFFWMALGLGVTALVAMAIASSDSMVDSIVGNRGLFFVVVLLQLGLVVGFGAVTAILWEFGEYFTFIRNNEDELRTAYTDTLGDLALGGIAGTTVGAALTVTLLWPRRRPATGRSAAGARGRG